MKKYTTPELKALNLIAEQAISFDDEEGKLESTSSTGTNFNDIEIGEW